MSRYAMCPNCGHRMSRDLDMWGNWDGETYRCDWCAAECDDDDDEALDVYTAAEIWASNGKDEDYMFGYSEDELKAAIKPPDLQSCRFFFSKRPHVCPVSRYIFSRINSQINSKNALCGNVSQQ